MFLHNVDESKTTIYDRKYIYLRFYSLIDPNFNFKDATFCYRCDSEFLNLLDNFSNEPKLNDNARVTKHTFLIDVLPDTLRGLIRMNNNIVEAFSLYLNCPDLNKLCKENDSILYTTQ